MPPLKLNIWFGDIAVRGGRFFYFFFFCSFCFVLLLTSDLVVRRSITEWDREQWMKNPGSTWHDPTTCIQHSPQAIPTISPHGKQRNVIFSLTPFNAEVLRSWHYRIPHMCQIMSNGSGFGWGHDLPSSVRDAGRLAYWGLNKMVIILQMIFSTHLLE